MARDSVFKLGLDRDGDTSIAPAVFSLDFGVDAVLVVCRDLEGELGAAFHNLVGSDDSVAMLSFGSGCEALAVFVSSLSPTVAWARDIEALAGHRRK
jgi:hypothetical protein